jgi:alanyl-tRNA synthetase
VTKFLTGNETRKMFLRFFEERGHKIVRSSSLVPTNDPTLLFTNAGMNQFKDVFLGLEQRDYKTATTCQKCVRAGGKHNDLENVGFTNRHLTFFEMLGNFSFGQYFKDQAIAYAMELITSPDWFALPLEKLYFTVFGGAELSGTKLEPDNESIDCWVKVGAARDRVFAIPGLKENFWQMGDTGPCGPCSEIFYDMGPAASDQGHADCKFPCDCSRYVEIWNLVFMQFNRYCSAQYPPGDLDVAYPSIPAAAAWKPDPGHQHGDCWRLTPLPKPSVDTGMGLERTTSVLQSKLSIFDTDLFVPLMKRAAELCGLDLREEEKAEEGKATAGSLRVIADHSRSATFLISDGVIPSNEGRGYVLRKIIRRALRHARMLNAPSPFLSRMSDTVRAEMKDAYPELAEHAVRITKILDEEEKRFTRTVDVGLRKLDNQFTDLRRVDPRGVQTYLDRFDEAGRITFDNHLLSQIAEKNVANASDEELEKSTRELFGPDFGPDAKDWVRKTARRVPELAGDKAFQLYDTYGLPRDFIEDVARDAGVQVDWAGFDRAMEEQRTRAKASWKGTHKEAAPRQYQILAQTFRTEPSFYFGTNARDCRVEAIVQAGVNVGQIIAGEQAEVILDRTSIYSESGGQVADTGAFYDNDMSLQLAEVKGAYYPVSGLIAHRIVAKEDLHVGDRVATVADPVRRARDMRNHTATHLMHAALRNVLGTHVKQAGSLVAPDRLRFDFSHFASVDASELAEIEQQVNEEILRNLALSTDIMNIDDALASGALAFFGDKYPESNVRVVTIPDPASPRGCYSKELCGGTHVNRTGEIGVFKITGEQSVAAGVRRIEAISGDQALAEYQRALGTLRSVSQLLNAGEGDVISALERQLESTKQLEKQLEALKRKAAGSTADSLLEEAKTIKDVRVLAAKVSGFDRDALRQMIDTLRQKLGSGVVVLFAVDDGKVALITGVTKDLTSRLHAGKIVQELAKKVGGSGGGRPDLAEAGGKDTSAVESALSTVYPLIDRLLSS